MSPQRGFCCRCRSESQNYDYFFLVSDTVGYDPFRGVVALDHDVEQLAAAHALAESIDPQHLASDYIIPSVFDTAIAPKIAAAVQEAAIRDGVARTNLVKERS